MILSFENVMIKTADFHIMLMVKLMDLVQFGASNQVNEQYLSFWLYVGALKSAHCSSFQRFLSYWAS